ncbi:glycosyltransferase [Methanophagales archaeon]|nr:MAG: glycosyltransferase [Methanophagales archaeon]
MVENTTKVSVILPTYNEKGNIIELVDEIIGQLSLMNIEIEIIVVDDNSPDNTGKLVQDRFSDDERVKVFIRTEERGLATAIRYGIEKSSGDILVVMDTDFNHDPRMLPQMVKFLEYYDIIVGSRFTIGGGMEPTFRYLGSFFYNMFIRIILHTQIQDNLSGFFAIHREKLFALDFEKIFFGYGDYFFRLLFYAQRRKFKILEIPVVYQLRKYGESKTNLISIFIKYSIALLKLRIQKKE